MARRTLVGWMMILGVAQGAAGQTNYPPRGTDEVAPQTRVVKLTLSANPAPTPALKYALLPELRDLKPGNAALLYQRAHAPEFWHGAQRHPDRLKLHEFLAMPLAKMPVQRVETVISLSALREVDRGARREYCDWDFTQRLREEGLGMLVPDVQSFRAYGTSLGLRARLELLRGELDQSHYTLQTGFALSRHLGDSPLMITNLVAKSIAEQMLEQLEEWIQQPAAPNLYWSLVDLPRPFLDLRKALQGEKVIVDGLFPEAGRAVQDSKAPAPTLAQVRKSLDELSHLNSGWTFNPLSKAFMAARAYPAARQWLLDQGRPTEVVDNIPVTVAWVMYNLAMKDKLYEDVAKWANVPYWEARSHLRKVNHEQQQARNLHPELAPLAWDFLPATERFLFAHVRFERRLAALQTVEALRLHAHHHMGKLPDRLQDIAVVPVPRDPVTGQHFQYRLEKGRGVLIGPAPTGQTADANSALYYEITLRLP